MYRLKLGMACVLLLTLLAVGTTRVVAHANLLRSEPAEGTVVATSPPEVKLWFTERLEQGFTSAYILNSNAVRIPVGQSTISPDDPTLLLLPVGELEQGIYTVVWEALSADDSHLIRGAFAFGIGDPATASAVTPLITTGEASGGTPFAVVSRWLNFLAGTLLLGTIGFQWLILGPFKYETAIVQRFKTLVWLAFGGLVLGWPLLLLAQAAALNGASFTLDPTAIAGVLQIRFGTVLLNRAAIIVALGLSLYWMSRQRTSYRTEAAILAGSLMLAVFMTSSLSSHAGGTGTYSLLAVGFDWLHLASTSAWVGGLVAFLLAIGPLRRLEAVRTVLPRFSALAIGSVILMTVTGLYGVWLHIPSRESLFETTYGMLLVGKILLVFIMLAIGVVNLVWGGSFARLRPRLVLEAGLGLAVIAVTASLVNTPPARAVVGNTFRSTQEIGGLRLTLTVAPNQVGPNRFTVAVREARDQPLAEIERISLRATMLDMQMGTQEIPLTQSSDGTWVGQGSQLSMAGDWGLRPVITRLGEQDVEGRFSTRVGRPTPVERGPLPVPADFGLSPFALGPLVSVPAGLVLAFVSFRLLNRRPHQAMLGFGSGIALVLIAAGMVTFVPMTEARLDEPTNPGPVTAQSIQAGRQRYLESCAQCHGTTGLADGPRANELAVPPANLWQHVEFHTDGGLYLLVSNGVKGTPMPAWGNTYSPEEIWDIVNFMRATFSAPTG